MSRALDPRVRCAGLGVEFINDKFLLSSGSDPRWGKYGTRDIHPYTLLNFDICIRDTGSLVPEALINGHFLGK